MSSRVKARGFSGSSFSSTGFVLNVKFLINNTHMHVTNGGLTSLKLIDVQSQQELRQSLLDCQGRRNAC